MTSFDSIFLDHHSTTPVDPRVIEAMVPFLNTIFANPASSHKMGAQARGSVTGSRELIANLLKCKANEVYFTSSATESNNLVIQGYSKNFQTPRHWITSSVEHRSVLACFEELVRQGHQVTFLKPNSLGQIHVAQIKEAIRSDTALVSIMAANNEIGTIYPIQEIAQLCRQHQIPFHCDATQGLGYLDFDFETIPVDFITASAHKFHGPKGIGLLIQRTQMGHHPIQPILFGGHQENGIRPGTLAVPLIVGMARALELSISDLKKHQIHFRKLKAHLLAGLKATIPSLRTNGDLENSLAHNLSLTMPNAPTALLMGLTPRLNYSAGSACNAGGMEHSHVLREIGLDESGIESTLRIGLGSGNTLAEMDQVIADLTKAYETIHGVRKD